MGALSFQRGHGYCNEAIINPNTMRHQSRAVILSSAALQHKVLDSGILTSDRAQWLTCSIKKQGYQIPKPICPQSRNIVTLLQTDGRSSAEVINYTELKPLKLHCALFPMCCVWVGKFCGFECGYSWASTTS